MWLLALQFFVNFAIKLIQYNQNEENFLHDVARWGGISRLHEPEKRNRN